MCLHSGIREIRIAQCERHLTVASRLDAPRPPENAPPPLAQGTVARWMTRGAVLASLLTIVAAAAAARESSAAPEWLSPSAIVASTDGQTLFVACATAARVIEIDAASIKTRRNIPVSASPSGLALSRDGGKLFVTCAAPESKVAVVDVAQGKVAKSFPAGHTTTAPVLSPDGKTLYVCNRFNNEVAFMDVDSGKIAARVAVPREPVAADLTGDGRLLFVANHIHAGRADADIVAAVVSVIDTASAKIVREIRLVNGSGLLRGVAVSPDGRHVAVTHQVSRFHLPTTQIDRGWINNAGLTLIDVATLEPVNTVLLDNIDSGAANPWAVAWTADGRQIVVTHAGTHELSVVDAPALLAKLAGMPGKLPPGSTLDYTIASHVAADVPNDLSFLVGLRRRIQLPPGDRGPRAIALAGPRVYVAGYFSDTVATIDPAAEPARLSSVKLDGPAGVEMSSASIAPPGAIGKVAVQNISLALNPSRSTSEAAPDTESQWPSLPPDLARRMTPERKGEFYFNDASLCFQGWQSCASCHSHDARVDGLNWDNLNDGIGNPKNAKSLLLAHATPPSMWLSVRESAYVAVRAGIKNSLFTVQPAGVADSIDAHLKSLKPIPSPRLIQGRLSPAAERGRRLFHDEAVGCADCHKGKFFTDQKSHDVGTRSRHDKPADRFDTPSLIEVWRSGPYLHDGSAATLREVLTTRNARDEHGSVRHLTAEQIDELVAYVLSL